MENSDVSPESALLKACTEGTLATVEAVLLAHPRINVNLPSRSDKKDRTPLMQAVIGSHVDIVALLMRHPDLQLMRVDADGDCAFDLAVTSMNLAVLRLFLENPKMPFPKLFRACGLQQHEEVRRLLGLRAGRKGGDSAEEMEEEVDLIVDVNETAVHGRTALYFASYLGDLAMVKLLAEDPRVNVNQAKDGGMGPIHVCCLRGHTEVIRYLLSHPRVDPNLLTPDDATPFIISCQEGMLESVKILEADPRVDVVKQLKNGTTPFYIACEFGRLEVVEFLLKLDRVDPNTPRETKTSPLFMACQNHHLEIIKRLLADPRIDVNAAKNTGATPFYIACDKGHLEVVKILIQEPRLDPNKPRENGSTPFYVACEFGREEVVRYLVNHPRININARRDNGSTPLFASCMFNKVEITKILLQHPDVILNECRPDGSFPLMVASDQGSLDVVRALLNHPKLDLNYQGTHGTGSLHFAAEKGHLDVLQALVNDPRIDVNLPTFTNNLTPLWFACHRGHEEAVRCILASSATVNTETRSIWDGQFLHDQTASDRAREAGKDAVGDLVDAYALNPREVKTRLWKELGYQAQYAGELFAMVILLCDDYLRVGKDASPEVRAFFSLVSRLPMDHQMSFCNRAFGQTEDVIPKVHSEAGFMRVARAFVMQEYAAME